MKNSSVHSGMRILLSSAWFYLVTLVVIFYSFSVNAQDSVDEVLESTQGLVIEFEFTKETREQLGQYSAVLENRVVFFRVMPLTANAPLLMSLGFFPTQSAAEQAASSAGIVEYRIVEISTEEQLILTGQLLQEPVLTSDKSMIVLPSREDGEDYFDEASEQLLSHAQEIYQDDRYEDAASFYQLLTNIAGDETAAWAMELLGVCYARLGYTDLALETYQRTIARFPENAGRNRVEQRLRTLETASDVATSSTGPVTSSEARQGMITRGSFGQYYRTLYRSSTSEDREKVLSLLTTNLDLRSSFQNSDYSLQFRLSGYHYKDTVRADNSELRLNRGFVRYLNEHNGLEFTLGRQKDSSNGVFGAYDGISASYPLKDNISMSFSAGEPVYHSDIYNSLDMKFYSAGLEWDADTTWRLSTYFNHQSLNSVTSREAIGFRTEYHQDGFSTALALDYDTAFSELNNMLLNINLRPVENVRVGASYGIQRSPFLSATNIFIGQSDLDIELYLQTKENQALLLDYALERTSLNKYFNISLNFKLTEKVDFLTSLYKATQSEIPSPEYLQGLDLVNENSLEYSQSNYTMQLNTRGLLDQRESSVIGVRRNASSSNTTTQIFLNERFRFSNKLSLTAKLNIGSSDISQSGDTRKKNRYSLDISYNPLRNTELSLELGQDSYNSSRMNIDIDNLFIYIGYRIDF